MLFSQRTTDDGQLTASPPPSLARRSHQAKAAVFCLVPSPSCLVILCFLPAARCQPVLSLPKGCLPPCPMLLFISPFLTCLAYLAGLAGEHGTCFN